MRKFTQSLPHKQRKQTRELWIHTKRVKLINEEIKKKLETKKVKHDRLVLRKSMVSQHNNLGQVATTQKVRRKWQKLLEEWNERLHQNNWKFSQGSARGVKGNKLQITYRAGEKLDRMKYFNDFRSQRRRFLTWCITDGQNGNLVIHQAHRVRRRFVYHAGRSALAKMNQTRKRDPFGVNRWGLQLRNLDKRPTQIVKKHLTRTRTAIRSAVGGKQKSVDCTNQDPA